MLVPVYALLSVLHRCLCADLTYYVEEGRSPGSYVGDIAADSHLMDNVPLQDRSLITFSQLQVRWAGSSQLFSVNKKTGKLYTAHTLDTESMCKHNKECFKMVEVAVEMGTSFMKILEIKVILKDINDNPPEFPVKQVNIQFEEDDSRGVRRSIPNAIDKDIGVVNSLITYHLKKNANDPFTLSVSKSIDGTSKLFINLEKKLDREVQDSYMVQVIAKDGGSPPRQSVLDVHISVTDVNDNSPIFTQKVYNVSIKNEPSETSPAVVLLAKDLDKNKYGRVTYQFSSKTSDVAKSHFEINELTGEIFLHKKFTLGRELTYKLYVEATDGGNPPLSSIAMVLVNVINEQNNAPTIDVNFVSASTGNIVSIPENIKVGSFIAYVRVTDHDAGLNGEVSCVLHHDKFQLQSLGTKKYKVILKKPLDRETKDYHEIIISCQDKGTPRLHSENRFEIQVVDVNDVRPQFSRKIYKFSINENQKAKFPVGYINATDPDLGPSGKLTYSLLSDNKHFLPFQINDDGLISTVMSLDHEFQDMYEFQVFVKDNGKPPLNNTVDVIVEVRDENDNSPYFTFPSISPFTMDFVYYPHHTKNITVLKASDSDSRQNAFLRYEITRGNDKQLFAINHYTGLLSFTHVVTQQDAGSYELEFVVKDSGSPVLSARTTLVLILTVSNKTYEIPNVIHMQANESEENIQLDILIAIVSVAVSVSVVITAFISICYIRYYNRRKDTQQSEMNYSNKCEQRQLMCLSYLAASCTDVPVVETEHMDMSRNSYLTETRGGSQHGDKMDIRQIGPASGMDLQAASEVIYQVSSDIFLIKMIANFLFLKLLYLVFDMKNLNYKYSWVFMFLSKAYFK